MNLREIGLEKSDGREQVVYLPKFINLKKRVNL
jgi:hypothetical protein